MLLDLGVLFAVFGVFVLGYVVSFSCLVCYIPDSFAIFIQPEITTIVVRWLLVCCCGVCEFSFCFGSCC